MRPYFQFRLAIFTGMKKNEYLVLGIMSGTSLDGIDVALLKFQMKNSWEYEILMADTFPYPEEWQKKLSEAVFYDEPRLEQLNNEYTLFLGGLLSEFIEQHELKDLDAICSHGHTIKHEPQNGYTLQIGNLPELATLTGQRVVCDFRVQDVELGGQGAPLVPVGDELLFNHFDYCLNLGGFANVSTRIGNKRIAYDICAVNTVMNHLAEKIGKAYDNNGEIAAAGNLDRELLKKLDDLEFYRLRAPKSLGIEWVNQHIFPLIENIEVPTALHTYTIHAADQIARSFNSDPSSKILVTGGGAFNGFLMEKIKQQTDCLIFIPSPELINYKEALIFGFLGILRLREEVNVLGSVTGASKDHSSGIIFSPYKT